MNAAITREDMRGLEAMFNHLTPKDGVIDAYFVTNSREEYDRPLRTALCGRTPEYVTLGRRGMKLDRRMIVPPDSILCW
jgi:hypothetical protein